MDIWAVRGKTRRIVPIRFQRAVTGLTQEHYPDIDDRGSRAPEFGPIVGVAENATVRIHVVRHALPTQVPLFATAGLPPAVPRATGPAPFAVTGSSALPATSPIQVELRGTSGG